MKTLSKNIITGSQRITGIVKSLRLFARLDEADKKPINLRETIESTLLLLQHKLSDKISVTGEYGEVPDVICYPAKISQVFMNILSNAIDAIDAKRNPDPTEQIMISTSQKLISGLDYVIATVSDSGCGIPQDTIKKVFDPFFTTKPVGRGMGLGLSISNNIVKEHGGNIEITSREGKGTSVSVYLPAKFEIT